MYSVPMIGEAVHYVSYGTPGGEYKSRCRAAIVSDNLAYKPIDERLDLVVLNPEGLFFNNDVGWSAAQTGGSWHRLSECDGDEVASGEDEGEQAAEPPTEDAESYAANCLAMLWLPDDDWKKCEALADEIKSRMAEAGVRLVGPLTYAPSGRGAEYTLRVEDEASAIYVYPGSWIVVKTFEDDQEIHVMTHEQFARRVLGVGNQ